VNDQLIVLRTGPITHQCDSILQTIWWKATYSPF